MGAHYRKRPMRSAPTPKDALTAALGWLRDPLVKVFTTLDHFDVRQPATLIARLHAEITRAFTHAKRSRSVTIDREVFRSVLDSADVRDWLADAARDGAAEWKRGAAIDPRHSLLLRLIAAADATTPLVSVLALGVFDPEREVRRLCEPVDLIEASHREAGEVRARAVIRGLRETVEFLYYPYLRIVWSLWRFQKAAWPRFPKTAGALVTQCAEAFQDAPGLVDSDAARFRNAGAHAQWSYRPADDTVAIWSRTGTSPIPPKILSVVALRDRLMAMYQIAGPTLFRVRLLYLYRDVLQRTGWLEELLRLSREALSDNPIQYQAAESRFADFTRQMFEPVRTFAQASSQR